MDLSGICVEKEESNRYLINPGQRIMAEKGCYGGRKDDSIRSKDGFVAEAPGAGVTLLGHWGPFCPGIINPELGKVFYEVSLAKFSRVRLEEV